MGEDKDIFWRGVGAGALGVSLVLYGASRLHTASYEKGWNGEELKSVNPLGIFGRTRRGDLVLISSFYKGKYDREVKLGFSMQTNRMDSLDRQIRYAKEQLDKTEIPTEERDFLRLLHKIANDRLKQPQLDSHKDKFYVA